MCGDITAQKPCKLGYLPPNCHKNAFFGKRMKISLYSTSVSSSADLDLSFLFPSVRIRNGPSHIKSADIGVGVEGVEPAVPAASPARWMQISKFIFINVNPFAMGIA